MCSKRMHVCVGMDVSTHVCIVHVRMLMYGVHVCVCGTCMYAQVCVGAQKVCVWGLTVCISVCGPCVCGKGG